MIALSRPCECGHDWDVHYSDDERRTLTRARVPAEACDAIGCKCAEFSDALPKRQAAIEANASFATALLARCPACGAVPGERCRTPGNPRRPYGATLHASRYHDPE